MPLLRLARDLRSLRGIPSASYGRFRGVLLRDPCAYCGEFKPRMDVDHIVPKRAGGTLAMHNVTASCWECNRRKGSRSLLVFLLAEAYKKGKKA